MNPTTGWRRNSRGETRYLRDHCDVARRLRHVSLSGRGVPAPFLLQALRYAPLPVRSRQPSGKLGRSESRVKTCKNFQADGCWRQLHGEHRKSTERVRSQCGRMETALPARIRSPSTLIVEVGQSLLESPWMHRDSQRLIQFP